MNSPTFETSREAYQWCLEQGIISQRIADVFKVLCFADGPMNQTMVHQAVVRDTGKVGIEKYSVSPRFAVLERMGLIRQSGTQACPVSGRTTVFYKASNLRPICTEKEAIDNAKSKESLRALKTENKELRDENAKLRELLNMRSAGHQHREEQLAKRRPVPVQTSFFEEAIA